MTPSPDRNLACDADDIPVWWRWAIWPNPIFYAQRALAVNEFAAPRWQRVFSGGQSATQVLLGQRGSPTSNWWIWLGVGVLIAFNFLLNVLCWVFHAYLNRECPVGYFTVMT